MRGSRRQVKRVTLSFSYRCQDGGGIVEWLMGARRREELKEAKDADVSDLDLLSVMSATVNNLAIIK